MIESARKPSFRRRSRPHPLVLLADDSRVHREMYAAYLSSAGFRIVTASDEHDAIAKAEADPPDVLVLDVSLPSSSGWAVARWLHDNPPTKNVSVIGLTGGAQPHLIERATEVGCDAVVAKPCPSEQLLRAMLTARCRER